MRDFVAFLKIFKKINPDFEKHINTLSLTTEDVECFHSTSHKKRDTPTVLEHSTDFGSTVRENIKQTHPNSSFHYFTASSSKKSSYIEPSHPVPLLPKFIKFPKLKKVKMSQENCSLMKEWAQEHVKQSARQETTKRRLEHFSMYKRPQPILDDVELIIDDENEDTEANEIQPEEEEEE